jgi:hypothetical protein
MVDALISGTGKMSYHSGAVCVSLRQKNCI